MSSFRNPQASSSKPSAAHQHKSTHSSRRNHPAQDKPLEIPPTAYIQAFEAQLIYDRPDLAARFTQKDAGGPSSTRGTLIRWSGDDEADIWADRHDILHLLPTLPLTTLPTQDPASPTSSCGSLPSDAEETFDLTTKEEIEGYQNAKRRKWMEALREDRLRVRDEEEEEEERAKKRRKEVEEGREGWAGDDEPAAAVLTLMSHTALSLSSSPNPKILEMRILANHAKDDRFSFLRGRYKDVWERVKMEVRKGKQDAEREKKVGLWGLMGGYDSDSDSDSDGDEEEEGEEGEEGEGEAPPEPDDVPPLPPAELDEGSPLSPSSISQAHPKTPPIAEEEAQQEEKRRIRREKAEEWKRQRALAQNH